MNKFAFDIHLSYMNIKTKCCISFDIVSETLVTLFLIININVSLEADSIDSTISIF
jgi:uncharacterized protein YueI